MLWTIKLKVSDETIWLQKYFLLTTGIKDQQKKLVAVCIIKINKNEILFVFSNIWCSLLICNTFIYQIFLR